MAADSRWTYRIGQDFDDGGVKLAALSSHAVAIYAGNAVAGEKAFAQLWADFQRARAGGTADPERILRAVWHQHRHQGGGLHVCLGFIDQAGEPHLFRFDHESDFRPMTVSGVEAPGFGRDYFLERLHEEVSKEMSTPLSEKPLALSAEHWSMIINRLVWETAERKADSTVGGPILGAIITKTGAQGRSLYSVNFGTDPLTVNRLSLSPSDVVDFYERQRKRRGLEP